MNLKAVTAYFSLAVVFMGLNASVAQEANRKEAKKEILARLHPPSIENHAPLGIKLLVGYAHKSATDFEGNKSGQIWKENGVKIRYEIGMSQGHAVDMNLKKRYKWHKEQTVHGRKVKLALDHDNTLLITIPLDEKSSWPAANFYGEIKKPENMVDMILMVLAFEL